MKRPTGKEALEIGFLTLAVGTNPTSLLSKAIEIPRIRRTVEGIIDKTTSTEELFDLAKKDPDKFYGDLKGASGFGDVLGVFDSIRETRRQLGRHINKEIQELGEKKLLPIEIVSVTRESNENIFKNVKRTFGFMVGLGTDYVAGGYNEALFGTPVPGLSGVRDALLQRIPYVGQHVDNNPYLFGIFAALAVGGLVSGIINVVQDGRFSRKANRLAIEKMRA